MITVNRTLVSGSRTNVPPIGSQMIAMPWKAMTPAQQKKVMAASEAASAFNNEGRIKEEAQIGDFFKAQGLTVTTPDIDAFRKAVQPVYAKARDKYGADVAAFLKDAEGVRKAIK